MSKKQNMNPNNGSRRAKRRLQVMAVLLALILVALVVFLMQNPWAGDHADPTDQTDNTTQVNPSDETDNTTENPVQTEDFDDRSDNVIDATEEQVQQTHFELDKGLVIEKIGSYTGVFMEDGSDEILSGVLMVQVTNVGSSTIQYAEVQLTDGNTTAQFNLSTLAPGAKMIVLERNRMPYEQGKDLTQVSSSNVALFAAEPSLCQDKIQFQALDGALNIINVSGADMPGDVMVYYKNYAAGIYYGGITYRITIPGGIKAGEIKQVTASHYTDSGSAVVFVTIGQ